MALIVLQHTAVDNFDVDPQYGVPTSSNRILPGMLVGLNTSGFLALAQNVGASGVQPLGIAGDALSNEYQVTAYSAQLIIGRGQKLASGAYAAPTRWTSPRVSDFYNETLASGKMTVYIGAGRFATDQYVTTDSWGSTQGLKVYPNAAGLFSISTGTSARPVGYVVGVPAAYPSGVPGADSPAVQGSMSLGTFLQVSLSI